MEPKGRCGLAAVGVVAMQAQADALEKAPASQSGWHPAFSTVPYRPFCAADLEDDDIGARRRVFAVDVGEDRRVALSVELKARILP
jgi:hypothetical protein